MNIIIISGPTASGKTQISLELASLFDGEIINFDSLLFYKEINIGTAKPNAQELLKIPHHLINSHSITKPINASDFFKIAKEKIDELHKKNKLVFLVGGSGFYLQALLKGMYDSATTPERVIKKSDELYKSDGITPFLDILKTHDPASFERYHSNDHYRIRRAVEHWWSHQTPFSELRKLKDEHNTNLNDDNIHGWRSLHLFLDIPKDIHQNIIKMRTHQMLENGLVEEVKNLLDQGFDANLKPLQSIGYKETIDYLNGQIKNQKELEEKINLSTRQLAKAQRTWFNRIEKKEKFNPLEEKDKIIETVNLFLK